MATIAANSLEPQRQLHEHNQNKAPDKTEQTSSSQSNGTTSGSIIVYDVEHLATFSTTGSHETNNGPETSNINDDDHNSIDNDGGLDRHPHREPNDKQANSLVVTKTTPKVALQKLFELEKLSGIWTQRMQIELREDFMLIVDCETNSIVEKFNRDCVTKPESFNQYNDIYNNIVVFIIQQQIKKSETSCDPKKKNPTSGKSKEVSTKRSEDKSQITSNEEGELHIFQCVSHEAQQLVSDILAWKSQTNKPSSKDHHHHSASGMAKATDRKLAVTSDKKTANSDHHQHSSSTTTTSSSRIKTTGEQINARKNSPSPVTTTSPSSGGSSKPVVTVASCASASESAPIANVNVKETVQVFNQIAALREKSKPASPINHARPLSDASAASSHSTPAESSTTAANGSPETTKLPTSPGGQFYKQRSIRATLAPKYATSGTGTSPANEQTAPAKLDSQNSGSTTSSSMASSSEPKAGSNYQMMNSVPNNSAAFQQDRHLAGSNRNGEHAKQSAQTNGKMAGSRSQQHPSQVNSVHHHHNKSSKTQSARTQQQRSQPESLRSRTSSSSQSQIDQVTTNESYVSVLNHCFDDIEKFIIRLQQAMAAARELQVKRKLSKRSSQTNGGSANPGAAVGAAGNPLTTAELAMLTARARGPNEDDYFEILSKFKLAFNLLAKLKGCIHEPNAPELVHFLFTPLAIIIESARNASPSIDPTLVGIPYLNQDALDLLSNCCTSKESDMWISLGPNWTQTIDINLLRAARLPDSFQPIFSDGWAPLIGELELIGLVAPPTSSTTGSIANQPSLAGNCGIPNDINDINSTNHHRHHQPVEGRHHHLSYLPDESLAAASGLAGYSTLNEQQGYSNGSISDGRLDKEKLQATGKELKKRNGQSAQPVTSRINHHDTFESSASQQPYLSPYGFLHESSNSQEPHNQRDGPLQASSHHHQRNTSSHSRANKHNSRHQDYPTIQTDYDPNYPTMSLQQQPVLDTDSQLDVDLVAHQYNHGDLYDHYDDQHHQSKGGPGPSSFHQYRIDKAHKHQQQRYQQARSGRQNNSHPSYNHHNVPMHPLPPLPAHVGSEFLNEVDQEAMLLDLGLAQTEWFFELQSRGAMIVRVLFTRDANNDKELSVRRGELLEVLDDTRKWWRARNIDLQVAHVPHTIVAIMHGYKTLDELLASNPGDEGDLVMQQRFSRRGMKSDIYDQQQWSDNHGDKRGSKNAGAFRYF